MIDHLISIARAAGQEILGFYGGETSVDLKSDASPLTAADLASHRLICHELAAVFPDIPICSEEGMENGTAASGGRFWLVDPLDGTKEFIKKTGCFTVNIALIEGGFPILGVILVPTTGVIYAASPETGAFRIDSDGTRSTIHSSAFQSEHPPRFVASRDHAGPEVTALLARFPGADCLSIGSSLKFCLVAEGKADIYLRDVPTMEWDTAAAHAILDAAGGHLLTWPAREPLTYGKPDWKNGSILAIGTRQILEIL